MRRDCRGGGWTTKITEAIENASDGDILAVATDDAKELAQRAVARMRPGPELSFEIDQLPYRTEQSA